MLVTNRHAHNAVECGTCVRVAEGRTLVLPRVASRRRADMSFVTDETDGTAVARLEVVKANQSIQLITISLTEASTI